jgi:multidrug efflux pump subunit AcrB
MTFLDLFFRAGQVTGLGILAIFAVIFVIFAIIKGLGAGLGSELRASFGMGVVGGLIFASLMTLYVIPAIFFVFCTKKGKAKKAE